jgi:hypothetical protein
MLIERMRKRLAAGRASFIEPCLPSPADKPSSGSNWIYEIKHDGFRLMARRDPVGIRLITRKGNDVTRTEIAWRQSISSRPASPSADNARSVESCADYGTSIKIGSPVKYSAGPHLQGPAALGERTHSQVFGSSRNVCQLHKVNVPLATG